MRKGISAAISFTMIIVVVATISVSIFYWSAGTLNQPAIETRPVPIQAYAYDSDTIKVINIGASNSSEIVFLGTSAGNCNFGVVVILEPGISESCDLPAAASGPVTIYGKAIRSATVLFD